MYLVLFIFGVIPILSPLVAYIALATILHLPLVISLVVGMLCVTFGQRWVSFILNGPYTECIGDYILRPIADLLDDIETKFEKVHTNLK